MQVKEMVECTRKAWNLVKGRLYTHGKLKVTLALIFVLIVLYTYIIIYTGSYFDVAYSHEL